MYNNFSMHYRALSGTKTRARSLRRPLTSAEYRFWRYVRSRKMLGYKFRWQHPIGNYIADFYCHRLRLVVEIDGSIHSLNSVQKNDLERESKIKELGLSVLRFTNEDVFLNVGYVEMTLKEFIEARSLREQKGALNN
jgi:very-short-patch-repair endonuclease